MLKAEIPHLRRYARALVREHETADDLVQDTLERAWRKRHLWRPSGRLRSWLFRILYRLYLDQRRDRQQPRENLIPLDVVRTELAPRAPRQYATTYCRDVLEKIDQLSDTHRAILLLVAFEQPSYREGARILGVRVGTFRSRLARARGQLEKLLAAEEGSTTSKRGAHG